MDYGLKDKVFAVTGGSRGLGLDLCAALLEQGAKVAICGRKQENLDSAVKTLGGGGGELLAVQAHIAKTEDVDRFFGSVLDKFLKIDVLINNVGMNIFTPSVAESDPSLFGKIIESNLTGTYLCSRKAAEIMKARKSGKIISISSTAASRAAAGMGIYGIAKSGIEMMTKVMASELAFFNIQVNAVAPGMVKTDFSKPFWGNEGILKEIVKNIPAGRIAETADVIAPVLFLSSDAASYISGQIIKVDGGASAR